MNVYAFARIKVGAGISQDMGFGKWPAALPVNEGEEQKEKRFTKERDAVFLIKKGTKFHDAVRIGYGILGMRLSEESQLKIKKLRALNGTNYYGNGSIYIRDRDGIEPLTPFVGLKALKYNLPKREEVTDHDWEFINLVLENENTWEI